MVRVFVNLKKTSVVGGRIRRSAQARLCFQSGQWFCALVTTLLMGPSVTLAESADQKSPESAAIVVAQASSQADRRAMVNLMTQLDGLNRDVSTLRGKIEELGNGILNAEKRQKDMYLDLDTRLRRIETANTQNAETSKKISELLSAIQERLGRLEQSAADGVPLVVPGGGVQGQPNTATQGGSQTANAIVRTAYEEAMAKYRAREYQDAIKGFQAIVGKYPGHPLAVNAQYWVGDSYYQLRAYRSAIDAQKVLLSSYPDSAKAPDALLTMGSAQLELGDAPSARQAWERLIATYPSSRAAAKASDRLARLP